jgi:nucleoside-diphosphate-sugar epimerase
MRAGKAVVVQGDGTSLWTLTHASDFARWFVGLFGNTRAIGDAFHITGDEVLTWNGIYSELARAAGVPKPRLVHVTSEEISQALPDQGPGLIGDRTHSAIFDCSKVRRLVPGYAQRVPFAQGAREIIAFFDAHPELRTVVESFDTASEQLTNRAVVNWDSVNG